MVSKAVEEKGAINTIQPSDLKDVFVLYPVSLFTISPNQVHYQILHLLELHLQL